MRTCMAYGRSARASNKNESTRDACWCDRSWIWFKGNFGATGKASLAYIPLLLRGSRFHQHVPRNRHFSTGLATYWGKLAYKVPKFPMTTMCSKAKAHNQDNNESATGALESEPAGFETRCTTTYRMLYTCRQCRQSGFLLYSWYKQITVFSVTTARSHVLRSWREAAPPASTSSDVNHLHWG